MKNILKYLPKIKDMILVFGRKYELKVSEYSDANIQIHRYKIYLQFGWVFRLNGGVVTW